MKTGLLFVACVAWCVSGCNSAHRTGGSSEPTWKIAGDLEEACSCRPPCPCWFKSIPSRMTCDGAQVVFIKTGRYGQTSLDGLAVAQFVQSPPGKSMFESFGNWTVDNIYIDERATEQQRTALRQIAHHLFPPAGKRQVRYAPITRRIDGSEHTVAVGPYATISAHLIEGGYAGAPVLQNPPLADPIHRSYRQGQTTTLAYSDAGQDWHYQQSNYMYNRFEVDDRQYAQFEAEMARKSAGAKH